MVVRKERVTPGESLTVWGNGCRGARRFHLGMRVYLVAESLQPTSSVFERQPPRGAPYQFLGRLRCTHTGRPQPFGDGGFRTGTLRFRVPRVAPGYHKLVLYCPPCRKGPGGNLLASLWHLDGGRRVELVRGLLVAAR